MTKRFKMIQKREKKNINETVSFQTNYIVNKGQQGSQFPVNFFKKGLQYLK